MAKRDGEVSNPETNDKTILTDELIEKISQAITIGLYLEQAALFCGVGVSTLHDWLKKGRENPLDYAQCVKLLEAVDKALIVCEARDLSVIDGAAHPKQKTKVEQEQSVHMDWRAAAWKLERRFPKRWGKKEAVEVSNPDGSLKPTVIITLPDNGRARKD